MKNLKEKRVKVTTDGQVIEYASIKSAADALDVKYQNVMNWLRGKCKPSIDVEVEYA